MKSICPLCLQTAEVRPPTGDWKRYDCPDCGAFEITGSEETVVKADRNKAQQHRERIARDRQRGFLIGKVG